MLAFSSSGTVFMQEVTIELNLERQIRLREECLGEGGRGVLGAITRHRRCHVVWEP